MQVLDQRLFVLGIPYPEQINADQVLAFDDFNEDVFNSLPDFLKDKIVSSEEFKAMSKPNEIPVDESDDIPF